MLDSSDREVFVSGSDPSMGTVQTGYQVGNSLVILMTYNAERRQFIVYNAGETNLYLFFGPVTDPTSPSLPIRAGKWLSGTQYGGALVGLRDGSTPEKVVVTEIL